PEMSRLSTGTNSTSTGRRRSRRWRAARGGPWARRTTCASSGVSGISCHGTLWRRSRSREHGALGRGHRAIGLALQLQLVPDRTYARDLARHLDRPVLDLRVRHGAHQRDHAVVRAHPDAGRLELLVRGEAITDRLRDFVILRIQRLALCFRNDLQRVANRLHAGDALRDLLGGGPLLTRGDLAPQGDDALL